MYSPSLGRFLQRDPAEYLDDPNEYAYVGGSPVNLVDPSGMVDVNPALLGGGTMPFMPQMGSQVDASAIRKAMIDAWAAQQKQLLANAINSIAQKGNYSTPFCKKCTPEMEKSPGTGDRRDAIVTAVANFRGSRQHDQIGGAWGDRQHFWGYCLPGTPANECGD